jgi:teichuronic acid biosynthesis glycosyltransferase TuaC
MKVLTFTTLWPNHRQPFHGLFVRERINALAKRCEVRVVAPVPWFVPIKILSEQYYKYTQVQRYEKQGTLVVFHPRFVVPPKVGKFLDGWLMFYSLRKFVQHLRNDFPYELIDAHYAYPDGYAASRIAKELGVPYTVTVRGSDITLLAREKLRGVLIRQSLLGASRVICVAESLKKEMITTLDIPTAKIDVIENGIDCQKFHPVPKLEARRQLTLPTNAQIVLSVGHLRELKGFDLLIETIYNLQAGRDKLPPIHLVIVGGTYSWEPSYKAHLVRRIAERGLHEVVSLVGPKKPEELKYWYSAADVFCLASSREGCPNVILESLACGTPVVATAVGGIPQIISKQELGFLVERNPESIRKGIVEALNKTWDYDKIIEHVQKHYSWERAVAKIYNSFERL